jgi:P-type Cu+ transporter
MDEAMLTGESTPVEKETGSPVYAGTLNLNGQAVVEVTAVGEATAMARIVAAVERAQNSRAEIQRLADRVSSVFVPVVVLVALAAALWWGLAPDHARRLSALLGHFFWPPRIPATPLAAAVLSAVAVLIVACPCAMGLATPVAIMVGANVAAKRGILIRDGIALEKAGQYHRAAGRQDRHFDGRQTHRRRHPRRRLAAGGGLGVRLQTSVQPGGGEIGSATEPIAFQDWREIAGAGVQATLSRPRSRALVRWRGCGNAASLPDPSEFVEKWSAQGATILGLALDGNLRALIALQDTSSRTPPAWCVNSKKAG